VLCSGDDDLNEAIGGMVEGRGDRGHPLDSGLEQGSNYTEILLPSESECREIDGVTREGILPKTCRNNVTNECKTWVVENISPSQLLGKG